MAVPLVKQDFAKGLTLFTGVARNRPAECAAVRIVYPLETMMFTMRQQLTNE
jgi:hypothetical protein